MSSSAIVCENIVGPIVLESKIREQCSVFSRSSIVHSISSINAVLKYIMKSQWTFLRSYVNFSNKVRMLKICCTVILRLGHVNKSMAVY